MPRAKMVGHVGSNLGIAAEDIEAVPFNERGGLGKLHQIFGVELPRAIEVLTRELAA